MIVRAIVARAVRFAIDGLEGPAHEEARESLERRLEDAEGRRRSLENDVLTLREQLGEAESNRARMKAGLDAVRAQRDFAFSRAEKAEAELEAEGQIACRNELRARIAELEARAEKAEAAESACRELRRKDAAERDALAAELAAIRAATGEDPTDEVLHAASMAVPQWTSYRAFRAVYNLGRDAARGEVARMREEVAAANAHAEPAYRTVKSIGEILSVEPDYEKVTDKVRDTANEVATLRDRVDGLEIDLNSAVQNSKANEVEANNLRSANRTLRDRVAELEAAPQGQPTDEDLIKQSGVDYVRAYDPGDLRKAYRLGLSHGKAAPQGQPVATDEEVVAVFVAAERDALVTHRMGCAAADRYGALAVARHVRAERPACLVARAVALGCDVRVAEDAAGWLVAAHESAYLDEVIERDIPAADVPATLSRLLDEVEAARKAGAK